MTLHSDQQSDTPALTEILTFAATGTLPTAIEDIYPFDRAAEAHHRVAAGSLTGRILLVP